MTDIATDIASLAETSVCVETTMHGRSPARIAFEDRFASGGPRAFPGWDPGPTALHVHVLRDAVLDASAAVLIKDRKKLKATQYFVSDSELESLDVRNEDLVDVHTDKTVIVGYNKMHSNYYHWIAQCVPAIAACLRGRDPMKMCIAMPQPTEMHLASLELMGVGDIEVIALQPGKQYRLRRVAFSDCSVGACSFANSRLAANTYARMRDAVEAPPMPEDKIYVARTDAWSRKLKNENEVIALLEASGYRIVVPGSMAMREQAQAFRRARAVIGPHGAGLSNIAFCAPGTLVYEMLPMHYQNSCFCNLALVCDLDYLADAFETAQEGQPNFSPWTLALDRFAARIDEIEAVLAERAAAAVNAPISAWDFLRGQPGVVRSPTPAAPPPVPSASGAFAWLRNWLGRG